MSEPIAEAAPGAPWPALLPWQMNFAQTQMAGRATWPHALLLDGPRGIG